MDGGDAPRYPGDHDDAEEYDEERDKEFTQRRQIPRPTTARGSRTPSNRGTSFANQQQERDSMNRRHAPDRQDSYANQSHDYLNRPGCSSTQEDFGDPNRPGTSGQSHGYGRSHQEARSFVQQVSRDELLIGDQARFLLRRFIQDRAEYDNSRFEPTLRDVCSADKAQHVRGFSDENLHDIASTLRRIGDDMSGDVMLNRAIDQVPIQSAKDVFMRVCLQMFADGDFNWGRIVALFYFAYKLAVRALVDGLDTVPWVKQMLTWVVDFIVRHLAKWIISRGGWVMIKEYFGVSNLTLGLLATSSALLVLWAWFKKD